jgi:catechol 2,3-dioxygenase-like lactoylglutathione lyase family enzyme
MTAPSPRVVGRIQAVTIVTPDLERALRFYCEGLDYLLIGRGVLDASVVFEGRSLAGRRWALLNARGATEGAVRLLEGPAAALPNRPRPETRPWDPGLAVLEVYARDPSESYRQLQAAGATTLSPPLPYRLAGAGPFGDIDVTSYAAFGPAGEQLFVTKASGGTRQRPELAGAHSGVFNVVLPNLDRRPVLRFYALLLGLEPTVDLPIREETVNQIIGAPQGTAFDMLLLGPPGDATGIEIEEFDIAHGRMYPTSLNRTGLAMFTVAVADLAECRALCEGYRIAGIGEGALPLPGRERGAGMIVRGALGELVELVGG